MKKNDKLLLPCLRGSIGNWNYYNVVMPFNELNRIDNDHIIKEDKDLDKWLQRNLTDRKKLIKEYLKNENERFFNSIIVGVYGDVPDWYSFNLDPIAKKFDLDITNDVTETLGILSLSGNEILFTIDGQHRVAGIKLALKENKERYLNDEISIVFVSHENSKEGRVRTRKLFATINREAKSPTANDLAIIDEIYAYNIIARDLYANYKPFKGKIALSENRNIDRSDHDHFANLLSLVTVNKKILRLVKFKQSRYKGPTLKEREKLYSQAVEFWDFVIKEIPDYQHYFSGKKELKYYRNEEKDKPLNLLFMGLGMKLIAEIYYRFKKDKNKDLNEFKNKIKKVNFSLKDGHFSKLYYNQSRNKIIQNNQTVAKNLFLYLLGEDIKKESIKSDLAKAYDINELSDEYKSLSVPKPL